VNAWRAGDCHDCSAVWLLAQAMTIDSLESYRRVVTLRALTPAFIEGMVLTHNSTGWRLSQAWLAPWTAVAQATWPKHVLLLQADCSLLLPTACQPEVLSSHADVERAKTAGMLQNCKGALHCWLMAMPCNRARRPPCVKREREPPTTDTDRHRQHLIKCSGRHTASHAALAATALMVTDSHRCRNRSSPQPTSATCPDPDKTSPTAVAPKRSKVHATPYAAAG
jgi:hypothetical protein